ncbi:MAG: hypothetical protein REI78_02175 [Pedobacter sp.]|nr:hypothetical protein [Pedobacter sp.]
MRRLALVLFLFIPFCGLVCAQDTSAYQIQRLKVNALLAERSAKFGQYDESLKARTGIFGFQTKQDIRNSNEILREIALTDNHIFQELKTLMDYKDLQVENAQSAADEHTQRILSYRRTIKNLQDQQEELNKLLRNKQRSITLAYLLALIALIGCVSLTYFLRRKIKLSKSHEKAIF